eukprot:38457-Chlamydomonas_euryale.AAC.4
MLAGHSEVSIVLRDGAYAAAHVHRGLAAEAQLAHGISTGTHGMRALSHAGHACMLHAWHARTEAAAECLPVGTAAVG